MVQLFWKLNILICCNLNVNVKKTLKKLSILDIKEMKIDCNVLLLYVQVLVQGLAEKSMNL